MPLPTLKHLEEEEASYSDSSSSCVFGTKNPAPNRKRNDTSSRHPEDETSSVDTAELVRSILHPSRAKHTSVPRTIKANDVEKDNSRHNYVEAVSRLSQTIPQQYPKSPHDATGEPQADSDDASDECSVDTTELVRRIMHPRDTLPSSSTCDRPEIPRETASSTRAPSPPSMIENPVAFQVSKSEDDFVLPDQSDSPSSSSGSSLLEEGYDVASVYSEQERLPFPTHHHPLSKLCIEICTTTTKVSHGDSSPPGLASRNSVRPVNSDQRYQRSWHIPDQGEMIASCQTDGILDVDSLENSAFGFSPKIHNGRDGNSSHGHVEPISQRHMVYIDDDDNATLKDNSARSDVILRQGLHCSSKVFSPKVLQSSVKSPYPQSAGTIDESIEKFSDDDEYNEAFGFGQAASTALERWRHRSGDKSSRNSVRNGPNCHQQRTTNLIATNRNEFTQQQRSDWSPPEETCLAESWLNQSSLPCHRSVATSGQSFPDMRREMHSNNASNSTFVAQPPRRPRIRDPSARPLNLFQPSNLSKPSSFLHSNFVSSAGTVEDGRRNWNADDFGDPSQPRNDVFGGSGVGVGSYQVTRQRVQGAGVSTENNRSTDDANTTFREGASLPSRKRPNSKVRRNATNNQVKFSNKRKKGFTYGGSKRGRGNWKATKKRSSSNTKGASHRNGPHRTSAIWAGNSDDPELRHVGGAEMSF